MTNLTKVASLTKKLVLPIIVLLIVGFLALLITIRFSPSKIKIKEQPTLSPIESPSFETLPGITRQFKTDNLSFQSNIPEELPIYRLDPQASFLPEANTFAAKLDFGTSPQELNDASLGQGLLFTKDDKFLSIYQKIITYQKTAPKTKTVSFDENFLKTKALDFITNLGILSDNLNEEPMVTYAKISNEGFIPTTDPSQADLIKFRFDQTLDGLKIITENSVLDITLDPAGDIINFVARIFKTQEKLVTYPILDSQSALRLLQNSKGSLISIKGEQPDTESLKNLGDISLTKAYLAYYLPIKNQEIIQPVWVFEGESLVGNLKVTPVYVVPAVNKTD